MKTQHTPGPWKTLQDLNNRITITSNEAQRESDYNKFIADVGSHLKWENGGKELSGANANLISAAPELLDALEELLHDYTTKDFDFVGLDPNLIQKCNEAIKKAKQS